MKTCAYPQRKSARKKRRVWTARERPRTHGGPTRATFYNLGTRTRGSCAWRGPGAPTSKPMPLAVSASTSSPNTLPRGALSRGVGSDLPRYLLLSKSTTSAKSRHRCLESKLNFNGPRGRQLSSPCRPKCSPDHHHLPLKSNRGQEKCSKTPYTSAASASKDVTKVPFKPQRRTGT